MWFRLLAVPILWATTHARAEHLPGSQPLYPPPGPYRSPAEIIECWTEIHYFDSLRTGPVDFCKQNLRYRPGQMACLQIFDRVCTVWYPGSGEYGVTRSQGDERLIRCPEGDEPPTCPRLRNTGRRTFRRR